MQRYLNQSREVLSIFINRVERNKGRKEIRQAAVTKKRQSRKVGSFQTLCFLTQYLKASTLEFFFPLPLSFPLRYIFQTLSLLTFLAGHAKNPERFPFYFIFYFFLPNRLERQVFLISFSFKLNLKGFGLGLIVELNK